METESDFPSFPGLPWLPASVRCLGVQGLGVKVLMPVDEGLVTPEDWVKEEKIWAQWKVADAWLTSQGCSGWSQAGTWATGVGALRLTPLSQSQNGWVGI